MAGMPAVRTVHVCQQCGAETPRWSGQCPSCEAWNTLVETVVARPAPEVRARERTTATFAVGAIAQIADVSSAEAERLVTGIGEVDRVLGGGFGMLKGLLGATLFFLLANLATDMVYGPRAERPEWMRKSRTYPLLMASGRAIVDWVEARRLKVRPVGEDE
jgi:hypothetical protein